jgi:FkbM family methyltransferase
VKVPSEEISVQLRTGTSDMAVYNQVFVGREYEFPHLPEEAKTIIDLGANIGLTSIFFALKYRDANILSVEPDNDNFMRLIANVGHFGDRVKPLKGAAWSRDGNLRLVKQGANEASLDSWGVRVSPEIDDKSFDVQCFSIPTLIGRIDGDSIDILKIDIEGSEKEIFTHSPEKWIGKIKMIVVETHDRFQPGCEQAVREAVKDKFLELERSGELLIFRSLLT